MNFKNTLFLLLNFTSMSFSYFTTNKSINRFKINNVLNNKPILNTNNDNKLSNFMKLIRSNNIPPVILLNFSGAWIINPSIINLCKSKEFIISIVNTIFIMSSAMIINDIFDINIDKINSPNKPLVNKSISIKEAYIYLFTLLGISQILSLNYLPKNMQILNNISTLNILIYTPLFKKITFIKNISCAFTVAFSIIFSALPFNILVSENIMSLFILSNTIFFGSLYNELLLDIKDKEGDNKYNIKTIPVLYGDKISINLIYNIIKRVIVINTILLLKIYNYKIAFVYPIIFSLLLNNLKIIQENNYSKKIIIEINKKTNKILFLLLGYFIFIVKLCKIM